MQMVYKVNKCLALVVSHIIQNHTFSPLWSLVCDDNQPLPPSNQNKQVSFLFKLFFTRAPKESYQPPSMSPKPLGVG